MTKPRAAVIGSVPSSSTVEARVTPPDSSGIIRATPRCASATDA